MTTLVLERSMTKIKRPRKSERVACNVNWTVFPNLENTAQFTSQATRYDFLRRIIFFRTRTFQILKIFLTQFDPI